MSSPRQPPPRGAGSRLAPSGLSPSRVAPSGLATERVVGLAAVRAVLETRPADALNLAHSREARLEVRDILRLAANERVAYRELEGAELERLAGTLHHEGVCLLTKLRRRIPLEQLVRRLREPGFILALDRVDNPHNVGAMLRSAAFFGARGLVCAMDPRETKERSLTPAMVRVAEGGAEHVPVLFTSNLAEALSAFAAEGVAIVGSDGAARELVTELAWPDRAVIVLGNERSGMGDGVRRRCTHEVRIGGVGAIESLNVSVAAGILMAARAGATGR